MKAPGVKLMKQQKIKKVPQRKCVGCGEMKDKKTLLRIVRSPEGEISLDLTGKKSGRGAYVCRSRECIKGKTPGTCFGKTSNGRSLCKTAGGFARWTIDR